jgi:hypothetical protein
VQDCSRTVSMVADHLPFHRAGQDSGDSVWGSRASDLRLDAAGRGTADSAGMGCGRTGAGIEGGQHRRHTGEVFLVRRLPRAKGISASAYVGNRNHPDPAVRIHADAGTSHN